MTKYKAIRETLKFLLCYLLYRTIGAVGIVAGFDAFSYSLWSDDFNLGYLILDIVRFLIAFGIVYGFSELKNKKSYSS
jgi:hypothetical protein